jgi:hypothetical protein
MAASVISNPFNSHRRIIDMPQDRQHEFCRYTSGRWLWDEDERFRERCRFFNVPELQKVAANVTGSARCCSMTKIGEGNFNKVFKLVMDDGSIAMARIPHPNTGPAFYTTESEVATMDFVTIASSLESSC